METALTKIQAALKAPKAQYNSFGKYNYRNCEDILEAVKPLLVQHGALLTISDKPIQVGDWVFIEASAVLVASDGAERYEVTASARHEDSKKGMDASQVSGAASSYARKYALNGLFLIDDSKDGDSTNTHGKDVNTSPPKTTHKPTAAPSDWKRIQQACESANYTKSELSALLKTEPFCVASATDLLACHVDTLIQRITG